MEKTAGGRKMRGRGRGRWEVQGLFLMVRCAVAVCVLQQSGKTTAKPETPTGEIGFTCTFCLLINCHHFLLLLCQLYLNLLPPSPEFVANFT